MKNNKGFTLVELLAILLIISLIAVITVPRIVDVIESTGKKIATESAYGYKKAVDEYFYHELVNKNDVEFSGVYNVDNKGKLFSETEDYEIVMDGQPPLDGVLSFKDSELTSGCLTINKYKVNFKNGEVIGVEKGACNVSEEKLIAACDLVIENPTKEEWFIFNESTNQIEGFSELRDETVTDLEIPCTINNKIVKSIKSGAFYDNNLTSVKIPSTVSSIELSAFENNKLTKVVLPENMDVLGRKAFANNELETIDLPKNITEIESGLLANNLLKTIDIPESVTIIGSNAFENNKLSSITLSNNIKEINSQAFANNLLENVKLPDDLTSIKSGVFSNNKLKNIDIPESVIIIDNLAFENNLLETIDLPDNLLTIGFKAFKSNKLTNVDIPDSVNKIDSACFNDNLLVDNDAYIYKRNDDGTIDNTVLVGYGGENKNIVIPNTVNTLEYFSLAHNKLESVSIPDSVVLIKNNAFNENYLRTLVIPNSVERIETQAFLYNALTTVDIPESVKFIGKAAFNFNSLQDEYAYIYKRNEDGTIDNTTVVSYGGESKNITLPDNIITIDEQAFAFNGLESVVFSNNVIDIKDSAFMNNELTSVVIPSNVNLIDEFAFYNNNLETVTLNGESKKILYNSFQKSSNSNPNLTTIYNNLIQMFLWKEITGGNNEDMFETGIIEHELGNINVLKSE